MMGIPRLFRSTDDGDLLLQLLDEERTSKADDEVDECGEQVHFNQAAVALRNLRCSTEEVGDRKHVDEGGVLEEHDGLRQQDRDHVPERLRQDDLAHDLPVVEAQCVSRGYLTAGYGLNSGPHDLAVVRRLKQRECNDRRIERADLD